MIVGAGRGGQRVAHSPLLSFSSLCVCVRCQSGQDEESSKTEPEGETNATEKVTTFHFPFFTLFLIERASQGSDHTSEIIFGDPSPPASPSLHFRLARIAEP